ncbi:MAG: signal peptidase I [Alphaproteobacteria bacterium]
MTKPLTDQDNKVASTAANSPKPTQDKRKQEKSAFGEFVTTIVVAVLIAVGFRSVAYEPFNIPSGSMYPTLLYGDYLLVSKFSYGYSRHSFPFSAGPFSGRIFESPVERGDVAVFKWPGDNRTDYIKRIVGLPGDTIETINGVLHINGTAVELEQLEDFVHPDSGVRFRRYRETLPNGVAHEILDCRVSQTVQVCGNDRGDNRGPFTVPEGHFFAMGDNRDGSEDSRYPLRRTFGGGVSGVGFVPMENLVGRADVLFFSTCGSDCNAPLWKPWNWIGAMRFDRFFDVIR